MFTPIHLLPRFEPEKSGLYQHRWEKDQGPALREKVLEMIREGAGEDFLQSDFENHKLGFLESQWDLKGINIFGEDVTFPMGQDSFEAIDFSYAQFYHSKFRRAVFNTNFSFARIYNCEFIDCVYSLSSFYGATLEKVKFINCEFIEHNALTNCALKEVTFKNCFVPENIFIDCCFDANTRVSDPINKPHGRMKIEFEKKKEAEIFQGIKEAYAAGGITKRARTYFFRQNQSTTRYNSADWRETFFGYFLEYLTGYGVRPLRVLMALFVLLAFSVVIFSRQVGFENALILAAGGFFTFGGRIDLLNNLSIWYKLWYVCTGFLGLILTALYVTVWANVWLRER